MQWMSWIHRRDLCALITEALVDKKYSGVINAVAPNPVLMKDFSQTLGKCLNRPNLLPVPGAVLKIGSIFPSAPPSASSTIPILKITNLEKNGFSAATSSHFLQRLAKKSFPPILFSVNSSDKLVP